MKPKTIAVALFAFGSATVVLTNVLSSIFATPLLGTLTNPTQGITVGLLVGGVLWLASGLILRLRYPSIPTVYPLSMFAVSFVTFAIRIPRLAAQWGIVLPFQTAEILPRAGMVTFLLLGPVATYLIIRDQIPVADNADRDRDRDRVRS